MRTRTRVLIVLGVVSMLAIAAPSAFASRGGGGAGGKTASGLSLLLLESTDGLPHWGQDVTFDVETNAEQPFVNVRCWQGEAFVYDGWAGFYEGAWFGRTFTLSSGTWLSGDADCTARLVEWGRNGRERTLATIGFHVFA